MGSNGTVKMKAVLEMLQHCASGFEIDEKTHHHSIKFNGKCYPALPKGRHGKRHNPEIQIGHVKKMARHLGIYDCAVTCFS